MLGNLVEGLLDLLWPPRTRCAHCAGPLGTGAVARLLCGPCWEGMGFPSGRRYCFHCARPLPRIPSARDTTGWEDPAFPEWVSLCPECRHGSPFGTVYALGLHEGALRKAIHLLKYEDKAELGILLGERLGGVVARRPDCLLPMPLHPLRLRERGYNQAAVVAQGMAGVLAVPVVPDGLVRRRPTLPQAGLDRENRLRNMGDAFGPGRGMPAWVGRRVLLVDDVLTTGATAAAAARVLWKGGAAEVDLAVLAVSGTPVRR